MRQIKNLSGEKVFLRVDFNVPFEKNKIKDDYKITAALPTIRFLLRYKCKIILASHLGDPGGKKEKNLSLKPVVNYLGKILGRKIEFVANYPGASAEKTIAKMKEGGIVMLENLRFHKGEEADDKNFARSLSELADIYINNAFAVCHRAHASVSAIKRYLPAYAGLLLEEEVNNLNKVLHPAKPLVVIIGGAKIATKTPLVKNFIKKARHILIGGAIANDFLKSLGFGVGKSLVSKDKELLKAIKQLYQRAGNKKIILPLDVLVSAKPGGQPELRGVSRVGKNEIILDIGPKTVSFYAHFIKQANTLVWSGPMGMFEKESFKHGTLMIARLIASRSTGRAFGAVGGGETIEALKQTKMFHHVDWVSTGGGAMLDYLSGRKLPGLKNIVKS